jgi:hypothetical protein
MITKRLQHGRFDECSDFWWRTKDKSRVVLQQVAGNCSDSFLLLGERGKDVGQITDVFRSSRKVI